MSEQGWRDFVAADGLDDWVVLHGGATAVFEAASFGKAAELAERVAELPDADGAETVLTITAGRLSVRLTRDMWQLERHHVALARQISAVAREHRATPVRSSVQEVQLAVAARPDESDVGFWRAVLGYAPASDDNAIDPLGHGSTIWMQELSEKKALRHAMHIDVSVPREQAQARVSAAIDAGGRIVASDESPASWILSDRAGNRVCIAAWPDGAVPRGAATET